MPDFWQNARFLVKYCNLIGSYEVHNQKVAKNRACLPDFWQLRNRRI